MWPSLGAGEAELQRIIDAIQRNRLDQRSDAEWQEHEKQGAEETWYMEAPDAASVQPRFVLEGQSPYGVMDMSGNVWQWCLNEYDNPEKTQLTGMEMRVLRGGSWFDLQDFARASYRLRNLDDRDFNCGCRVVAAPIP